MLIAVAFARLTLAAQVQTKVPPEVPGAKPVTVERAKITGQTTGARHTPTLHRRRGVWTQAK